MQNRYSLWWSLTLILSIIAVGLVNFVFTNVIVRPVIVMWFLFVCPGMAVTRLLNLKEVIAEWALALALSFSIDAIIASILLYAGMWSPSGILVLLMAFCCCCVIGQALIGAMRILDKLA
jgi:hypothetical protein